MYKFIQNIIYTKKIINLKIKKLKIIVLFFNYINYDIM